MSTNDSRVDLVVTPDAQGAYVKASGRFMPRAASDLAAWVPALALAVGRTMTLDLCGVVRMDAAGLGLIATLTSATRESEGRLQVVSAPPRVRRMLELTGLDRVVDADAARSDRDARVPCEPLPQRYYHRRRGAVAEMHRAHSAA